MTQGKRAALYLRVSTDAQSIENQRRELRQIAERRGWQVVEEYHDAGTASASFHPVEAHGCRRLARAGSMRAAL